MRLPRSKRPATPAHPPNVERMLELIGWMNGRIVELAASNAALEAKLSALQLLTLELGERAAKLPGAVDLVGDLFGETHALRGDAQRAESEAQLLAEALVGDEIDQLENNHDEN